MSPFGIGRLAPLRALGFLNGWIGFFIGLTNILTNSFSKCFSSCNPGGFPKNMRIIYSFALILLVTIPTLPVSADIFLLTNGKSLEGNIVREIGDLVSIRTLDGKIVTIDKNEITKVTTSSTPLDEYNERSAKIKVDDVQAHVSLALWCTDKGLQTQASIHWKRVIALSPDHLAARKALGYIWIGGDWYLAGSAEAVARKKEMDNTPAESVPAIPEKLPLPDWEKLDRENTPDLPPGSPNAQMIVVVADEKLGRKKVESSGLKYQLNRMGGKVRFSPGKQEGAASVLKVKLRCYFVRQQDFYGAPIANIYQGEAQLELLERNAEGKLVRVHTGKVKMPFSAGVGRSQETALNYTYYKTLEAVASRVSRWSWLKKRGTKVLAEPEK